MTAQGRGCRRTGLDLTAVATAPPSRTPDDHSGQVHESRATAPLRTASVRRWRAPNPMTAIRVENVYKVFGRRPQEAVRKLRAGATRDEGALRRAIHIHGVSPCLVQAMRRAGR